MAIRGIRLRQIAADQRGVATMEFGILGLFIIALLLPISDVAAVAITYMRTYQAMRDVAAYVQYNPPPDITNPRSWPKLPNNMSGYSVAATSSTDAPAASAPGNTISINITVLCGDPPGAACTATDVASATTAKWYYLSSNVQLNPMFLTGLTGGVLAFSHRFQ